MMVIDNKYTFGDILYLVTDQDQLPRMVTAIIACPAGDILYELSCGTLSSKHYDFELSEVKILTN